MPKLLSPRRGVVAVLVALLTVVLFAAAAFTVDFAYMHLTRSELQSATDAAARAATFALGTEQDMDAARQRATEAAALNTVAGAPLSLDSSDVKFGRSDLSLSGRYVFVEGGAPTSAVQITGRRTQGALDGPVALFLGALLGRSHFEPTAVSVASRLDRDICIVVDRSGSMAWDESGTDWSYPLEYAADSWQVNYVKPPHPTASRWAALVGAVHVFRESCLNTNESEHLALVSYSNAYTYQGVTATTVTTHQQLTADYTEIEEAINAIGEEPIIGGTNIGAGLQAAIDVVMDSATARPFAFKTIVLMTDGVWNAGLNPTQVALTAASNNIVVHTVTFSDGANHPDMAAVATITGGKHYHAPTGEELIAAFNDIAYSLPVIITQ